MMTLTRQEINDMRDLIMSEPDAHLGLIDELLEFALSHATDNK